MLDIIYFSNVTETTKQFVDKINLQQVTGGVKHRIPIRGDYPEEINNDYILIVPTYGDAAGRRHIPHQVKNFLNNPNSRAHIKGVIACGNRNFGKEYGRAGDIIAQKLQ